MTIRPIRSHEDHASALDRIDALWGAEPGTPEGDELDVLLDLVEHYEDKHFRLPASDPVALLRAHVEERENGKAELTRILGSEGQAVAVLEGTQALTREAIERLAVEWHIRPESLEAPARRRTDAA